VSLEWLVGYLVRCMEVSLASCDVGVYFYLYWQCIHIHHDLSTLPPNSVCNLPIPVEQGVLRHGNTKIDRERNVGVFAARKLREIACIFHYANYCYGLFSAFYSLTPCITSNNASHHDYICLYTLL